MPDYMSDEGDSSETPDAAPADDQSAYDDQPASQTALLPTDFFGGKSLQPGATCTVKIVKVLDGQVQVSYEGAGGGEPDADDMMQ